MADVFISYRNTPDRRIIVRRLATILRAHEISVWWDYGLEAGESYRAQITAELASARVVSPLWCAESVQSKWVRMEAELGKDKLVPARLQKVVPPDAFEAIQAADLIGWDGAVGSPRLLEFIRLICKRLGRLAIAPTDMIEDLGQLPPVAPLPEVANVVPPVSSSTAATHDYAFWKGEWETHRGGSDLHALQAIAAHAPPYFATQARARIAEIEAEQERLERERAAAEARQRAEAERIAREKAAAEQRAAKYADEGRIKVDGAIFSPRDNVAAQAGWLKPGAGKIEWFKDLDIGPEMVVVPGSPAFAIGRFAITFAEWDAAQAHPEWERYAKIEPRKANDHGWDRGKQPAIDVSWNDAKAYCAWLSAVAAKTYRLPSEAEWEQVCRAGTKTEYWWGDKITADQANFGMNNKRTLPVDNFEANPWGLYQVHGNVWEWCEDAYDSSSRVGRGGAWGSVPDVLRSSNRDWGGPGYRSSDVGFRVARVLSPARTL
jgi:formylglycine-generating enzyme required for sulfatase activity